MAVKNKLGMGLTAAFHLPPEATTLEAGRELFEKALPGYVEGRPEELKAKSLRLRAQAWADAKWFTVDYTRDPQAGAQIVSFQVAWDDESGHFRLGVPRGPGERVVGFAIQEKYVDAAAPAAALSFVRARMVAAFDALRPRWGCIDTWDGLGVGTGKDPRQGTPWVAFLRPEDAARAPPGDVETRPWGGLVVTARRSPFA